MDKKIIIAVFCVISLIACAIPATGGALETKINELKPILDETLDVDEFDYSNLTIVTTVGPINKLSSKIELIDGEECQINQLKKYFNRIIFKPAKPYVLVNNLTFSVEYLREPKLTRFIYATVHMNYSDYMNLSDNDTENDPDFNDTFNNSFVYNKPHKLLVKNFTGIFFLKRARLIRYLPIFPYFNLFEPAFFTFSGYCEEIEITMT